MSARNEVILLIKMYNEGKYGIENFCELFIEYYFFSKSAHRYFQGKEKEALDELAKVAEFFSDNIEETDGVVDIHIVEADVKAKVYEVLEVLEG